jgi:hypothetical protein
MGFPAFFPAEKPRIKPPNIANIVFAIVQTVVSGTMSFGVA